MPSENIYQRFLVHSFLPVLAAFFLGAMAGQHLSDPAPPSMQHMRGKFIVVVGFDPNMTNEASTHERSDGMGGCTMYRSRTDYEEAVRILNRILDIKDPDPSRRINHGTKTTAAGR